MTILAEQAAQASRPSRLYPGFGKSLSLLCLGIAVSFAVAGFKTAYYTKAASDMVSVYEALLFNAGLPPEFFVYPGLIDRVGLGLWFSFLHVLGLAPIWRIDQMPPGSDLKVFEAAWQSLVEAARVYSLATGLLCTVAFVWLIRRWLGDWRIAVLAGTAWAFSGGIALAMRILRPEMLTAALVFFALLLVLIAARDGRSKARFGALALAGLLVALAVIDKVQSVIPALTILPVALAFGPDTPRTRDQSAPLSWVLASALAMAAAIALWPAVAIFAQGIAQMPAETATTYKTLSGGMSGTYQIIVAAGIVAAMAAYGAIWRRSAAETLAGIASVGLGLALGFDLLYLNSSSSALTAVANPLEHLQSYSEGNGDGLLSKDAGVIGLKIADAIKNALAVHTFLKPTHRPTLIIEWLAIAAGIAAWRRGEKLHALQIALLVGAAIGQDALFSLRVIKSYYLPYSDTPIVIAGALALTRYAGMLELPRIERVTAIFLAVYVIWGHATLARATLYGHHDRGKVCGIVTMFTSRITYPYCQGKFFVWPSS